MPRRGRRMWMRQGETSWDGKVCVRDFCHGYVVCGWVVRCWGVKYTRQKRGEYKEGLVVERGLLDDLEEAREDELFLRMIHCEMIETRVETESRTKRSEG